MKQRLLITGVSGFIGSRLAIRCREAGHEVIATARQPSPDLEAALGLKVHALDVLDPATIDQPWEADALLHCATANDIVSRDFAAGVQLSVNGTRHVLELALQRRIPRVIFFSTLQVYGTELEGTITEDTPPHCESPYGLNHLLGEEVCRLYAHKHGLNVALLRPANVYGVPDAATVNRATLVPMCFVKTALATGKLTLHSSGQQQRNFVSTDEVANACLHVLQHFPSGAQVINVGSNWLTSIRHIASLVAQVHEEITGQPLPVEFLSDQPLHGNQFLLGSRLASIIQPAEASATHMLQVIRRLYAHFQSIP